MNREEILAASRKENKNQDIVEAEYLKQASRVAYTVGCLVCCLICALQWSFTKTMNWGCWVVNFSILGTIFLVKSIKVKYSRLKSRACNNPEVQTPQGLLP